MEPSRIPSGMPVGIALSAFGNSGGLHLEASLVIFYPGIAARISSIIFFTNLFCKELLRFLKHFSNVFPPGVFFLIIYIEIHPAISSRTFSMSSSIDPFANFAGYLSTNLLDFFLLFSRDSYRNLSKNPFKNSIGDLSRDSSRYIFLFYSRNSYEDATRNSLSDFPLNHQVISLRMSS